MKRLAVLVALLATLSVGTQAIAAGRYCGTGTKVQGLTKSPLHRPGLGPPRLPPDGKPQGLVVDVDLLHLQAHDPMTRGPVLDVNGIAAYTTLGKDTVKRLMAAGEWPVVELTRQRRGVLQSRVDEWLAAREVPSRRSA